MSRQHRLALLLAIAVGIGAGVVIGYLAYAVGRTEAISLGSWLDNSFRWGWGGFRYPGIWWGVAGGAAGAALFYIRRLTA